MIRRREGWAINHKAVKKEKIPLNKNNNNNNDVKKNALKGNYLRQKLFSLVIESFSYYRNFQWKIIIQYNTTENQNNIKAEYLLMPNYNILRKPPKRNTILSAYSEKDSYTMEEKL